jgi:hypothetical protein
MQEGLDMPHAAALRGHREEIAQATAADRIV